MKNISVIGEPSTIRKHLIGVFIDYAVNAVLKLLPVSSKMIGISITMGSKQITMPIAFNFCFIWWQVSEI
jgi:hypothetical protein